MINSWIKVVVLYDLFAKRFLISIFVNDWVSEHPIMNLLWNSVDSTNVLTLANNSIYSIQLISALPSAALIRTHSG